MTDWSDEVEARLHAQGYECHCTSPDDCCQDCADIRAALGEIERRGERLAQWEREEVTRAANCCGQEERAEAAEIAQGVTRIARASEECARAERIRCRDEWAKSAAEVERLTTTVAHLSKRASEYEADRDRNAALCMDARADADRLRDALRECQRIFDHPAFTDRAGIGDVVRAALRGGGE